MMIADRPTQVTIARLKAWRRKAEFSVFRVAYSAFCDDSAEGFDKAAAVAFESLQFAFFPLLCLGPDLAAVLSPLGPLAWFLHGLLFNLSSALGPFGPAALLVAFALHSWRLLHDSRHGVPAEDSWAFVWTYRLLWRTLRPLGTVAVLRQAFSTAAAACAAGPALTGFGALLCAADAIVALGVVLALVLLSLVDYSACLDGPSARNRAWSGSLLQELSRVFLALLVTLGPAGGSPLVLQFLCLPVFLALAAQEVTLLTEPALRLSQVRAGGAAAGVVAVILSVLMHFQIIGPSAVLASLGIFGPLAALVAARITRRHFERRTAPLPPPSLKEVAAAPASWAHEILINLRPLLEKQEVPEVESRLAGALQRDPDSQALRVAYAEFLLWSKDPSTLIQHLCKLSNAALSFPYRFRMYCLNRRRVDAIEQMLGESSLTFQEEFRAAKSVHIEALARIRSFWETLMRNDLDPHVLAKVSESIGHSRRRGDSKYRRLLGRFRSRRLISAYSRFLNRVSWDLDLSERYMHDADEMKAAEAAAAHEELYSEAVPLEVHEKGAAPSPANSSAGDMGRPSRATMRGRSSGGNGGNGGNSGGGSSAHERRSTGRVSYRERERESDRDSLDGGSSGKEATPRHSAATPRPVSILKGPRRSTHSSVGVSARVLSAIGIASEEDSYSETGNNRTNTSTEAAKQTDLRQRVKAASNSAAVDSLLRRTLMILVIAVLIGWGYYVSVRSLVENTRRVVGVLGSSVERTRLSQEAPLLALSIASARARGDAPAAAAAQASLRSVAKRLHALHKSLYTADFLSEAQLRTLMEDPIIRTSDALSEGGEAMRSLWDLGNRYVRKALDVAESPLNASAAGERYAHRFLVENAEVALRSFSNATSLYCWSNVSAGRLRIAMQVCFAAFLLLLVYFVKEHLIAPVIAGLDRERKIAIGVFSSIPKQGMGHLVEGLRKEELSLLEEQTEWEAGMVEAGEKRNSVAGSAWSTDGGVLSGDTSTTETGVGKNVLAAAQSAAQHARAEGREGGTRRHSPTAVTIETHMWRRVMIGLVAVSLALIVMLSHSFWLANHGLGIANEIAASGDRSVLVRRLHLLALQLVHAEGDDERVRTRALILEDAMALQQTHLALVFGSVKNGIAVGPSTRTGPMSLGITGEASTKKFPALEALMYASPAMDPAGYAAHFGRSAPDAHAANRTGDFRASYCMEFSLSRYVDEARALAMEPDGSLGPGSEHLRHIADADSGLLSQQLDLAIDRFAQENLAGLTRSITLQETLLMVSLASITFMFLAVFIPILTELRDEGDLTLSMLCMVPSEELDKIDLIRQFLDKEKQGGYGTAKQGGDGEFDKILAESRQETRNVIEAVYIGVAVIDSNGEIVMVNHAAEEMFGVRRSELIGQPAAVLIGRALYTAMCAGSRDVLGKQREVDAVRRDGTHFPCNLSTTDIAAAGGKRNYIVALEDITKQKAAEAAVRESEEHNRSILEAAWDCIISADSAGIILQANTAVERSFHFPINAVLGRPISVLVPALSEVELRGIAGRFREMTGRRADGSEFPVEVAMNEFNVNGKHMYTGIVRDLTSMKAQEAAVHASMREAQASNAAKRSFLANISHEIRTPLNGIIGMSQLLLETNLEPDQHEYSTIIHSCGTSLMAIVNDVLDFSKIEAGKLELHPEVFCLDAMLESVLDCVVMQSCEKSIDLLSVSCKECPHYVYGDPKRIGQILLNFLSNGVKFTREGFVALSASLVDPAAASPGPAGRPSIGPLAGRDREWITLRFEVRDSGLGIREQEKEKLFRRFSQIDTSSTRQFQGTGLGLAISKELAGLMGGAIGVESSYGSGSTFWVTARVGLPTPAELCEAAQLRQRVGASPTRATAPEVAGCAALAMHPTPAVGGTLASFLASLGLQSSAACEELPAAVRSFVADFTAVDARVYPFGVLFVDRSALAADAQLGSALLAAVAAGGAGAPPRADGGARAPIFACLMEQPCYRGSTPLGPSPQMAPPADPTAGLPVEATVVLRKPITMGKVLAALARCSARASGKEGAAEGADGLDHEGGEEGEPNDDEAREEEHLARAARSRRDSLTSPGSREHSPRGSDRVSVEAMQVLREAARAQLMLESPNRFQAAEGEEEEGEEDGDGFELPPAVPLNRPPPPTTPKQPPTPHASSVTSPINPNPSPHAPLHTRHSITAREITAFLRSAALKAAYATGMSRIVSSSRVGAAASSSARRLEPLEKEGHGPPLPGRPARPASFSDERSLSTGELAPADPRRRSSATETGELEVPLPAGAAGGRRGSQPRSISQPPTGRDSPLPQAAQPALNVSAAAAASPRIRRVAAADASYGPHQQGSESLRRYLAEASPLPAAATAAEAAEETPPGLAGLGARSSWPRGHPAQAAPPEGARARAHSDAPGGSASAAAAPASAAPRAHFGGPAEAGQRGSPSKAPPKEEAAPAKGKPPREGGTPTKGAAKEGEPGGRGTPGKEAAGRCPSTSEGAGTPTKEAPRRPSQDLSSGSPTAQRRGSGRALSSASSTPTRGRSSPVVASHELDGLHILIVEDNAINRRVAQTMLERMGATTATAADGVEGVEAVVGCPPDRPFALVFMDCAMPRKDGYTAADEIRRWEAATKAPGARLPIVGLTAHASTEDHEQCLRSGMDAVITKPILQETLLEVVLKWASRKK